MVSGAEESVARENRVEGTRVEDESGGGSKKESKKEKHRERKQWEMGKDRIGQKNKSADAAQRRSAHKKESIERRMERRMERRTEKRSTEKRSRRPSRTCFIFLRYKRPFVVAPFGVFCALASFF